MSIESQSVLLRGVKLEGASSAGVPHTYLGVPKTMSEPEAEGLAIRTQLGVVN